MAQYSFKRLKDLHNKVFTNSQLHDVQGIGETGVNIFCREAQLQWEELFPFADSNSLELAKNHGYPSKDAKELAEFVDNDRYLQLS